METFDGHVQVNRYDAEGLRYEMEENGNLVRFIFNPDREAVVEEDSTGLARLIRGTELIARSTDAARTYYHYASDEMGSTTHIVDEAGAVQNRYEYDAWGNLTVQEEAVPNRFKYTGQQFDPVTQQYYLRARFYNPVIARFTQEDTYRGDGLNLYAYCANNPVLYVDPTGNYRNCVKEAYDLLRKLDPNMKAVDAYQLAKQQCVIDGSAAIDSYQVNSGTILTPEQRNKFILDAVNGNTVENLTHIRKVGLSAALKEDPNFSGLQSLVSYDQNNNIQHHAATITPATRAMGGTRPTPASRRWLENIVRRMGISPKHYDYGHIIAKSSGGGGGLTDHNGFIQHRGQNRGLFNNFQQGINKKVDTGFNVSTFVELSYANNSPISPTVSYTYGIQNQHQTDITRNF